MCIYIQAENQSSNHFSMQVKILGQKQQASERPNLLQEKGALELDVSKQNNNITWYSRNNSHQDLFMLMAVINMLERSMELGQKDNLSACICME